VVAVTADRGREPHLTGSLEHRGEPLDSPAEVRLGVAVERLGLVEVHGSRGEQPHRLGILGQPFSLAFQ
jgi:hypothetical protein